ncbi:acetyltransferase [Paenibacillus cisolokensis]|uniref:acetyltransferase n=1 Tax=Paenibacillus cisolokensis TaxID=1658519 RepID=UPI003D2A8AA5
MNEHLPVAIIGGGGHAEVVWDALQLCGHRIIGFVAPQSKGCALHAKIPWLGSDEHFCNRYNNREVLLANGIGTVRAEGLRDQIYQAYRSRGYRFITVAHPGAIVSGHAVIEEGAQIMAGAVVQSGAVIGENAIVNTRSSVDHHTRIGRSVHIAPGAVVCGNVEIGAAAFIGAGATIVQGICIGQAATVGGGAVVIRNVPDGVTVMGNPAKESTS